MGNIRNRTYLGVITIVAETMSQVIYDYKGKRRKTFVFNNYYDYDTKQYYKIDKSFINKNIEFDDINNRIRKIL